LTVVEASFGTPLCFGCPGSDRAAANDGVHPACRETLPPNVKGDETMKFTRRFAGLMAAAAIVMSVGLSAASAQDKVIRIGTEGAYPPFNFIDQSGKLTGFDIDIGMALCEQMKAKCELVAQDWDGIIPALVAGKYDVIIASMFITEERKKVVSFTDPYYAAAMTHVTAVGSDIKEFSDAALAGKAVGAQSSTTQAEYIQKTYPSADIRLYKTQDEANLDMANGRLDVMVGDVIPMLDWTTKSEDGKCCEIVGEPITDKAFVGDGVGMAVRQDDNELRDNLNKALAEIIANGTYKKINDKYFTINVLTMKKD
jgi:polar amino acid transport system substrate-binding protein